MVSRLRLCGEDESRGVTERQATQRWIPCSERVPDETGYYLVTMRETAKEADLGFDLDSTEVKRMRFDAVHGWALPVHIPDWINEVITTKVLAWMDLPEPYQPGGAE